jgi:hypothetical protein
MDIAYVLQQSRVFLDSRIEEKMEHNSKDYIGRAVGVGISELRISL